MANLHSKLSIAWFLFFITNINQSSSARTITNPTPTRHHHSHHKLTFLMQDMLSMTNPSPKPATTFVTTQLPFPKPLGLFPPNKGIPLPESNPTAPDVSNIGLPFPAIAARQELEFGRVFEIDEDLFDDLSHGSPIVGKAQGIYVASSEDGSSFMMAMTANFAKNEFKDGLRFFGVNQKGLSESHVAVIGGTGKFQAANGYAVIKVVDAGLNASGKQKGTSKLLLFNVYLS